MDGGKFKNLINKNVIRMPLAMLEEKIKIISIAKSCPREIIHKSCTEYS